jgi:hypothetical protein
MPQDEVADLFRQGSLRFLGTIEQMGAATMVGVPIDGRTDLVHVIQVLRAPEVLAGIARRRLIVPLSVETDPPTAGDTAVFLTRGRRTRRALWPRRPDGCGLTAGLIIVASPPTSENRPRSLRPSVRSGKGNCGSTALHRDAVVAGRIIGLERPQQAASRSTTPTTGGRPQACSRVPARRRRGGGGIVRWEGLVEFLMVSRHG